ncbi:hypothetical protein PN600_01455, partial [Parabacteroides distasonis]|uniref:hypothetical protein n=1 Tax=Parabacteroides distasonis TaxID=823 RepID=UPI001E358BCA
SNGYKILSFQTYKAVCLIPQVYRVSRVHGIPQSFKRKESMHLTHGAHPVGQIHASFPNYYGKIIIRNHETT